MYDLVCRLAHVAGSAVVAEPFPQFEHVFLGCRGQGVHRRKRLEKPHVIRDDRVHPRLLQHNFSDPHRIRRALLAPRQLPAVFIEPIEQRLAEVSVGPKWRWTGSRLRSYRHKPKMLYPASTWSTSPVMPAPSSLHKNSAVPASSDISTRRRKGARSS